MGKAQLEALLKQQEQAFLNQGGSIIRYASPENPNKIRLGASRKIPNLREMEWRQELERMERERNNPRPY